MQAHVSFQTIADMVNRYSPEQRKRLNGTLKLPALALERWLKKPTEADILTNEQIEMLADWVLNKFVHVSSKEGYIKLEERVVPTQQMPVAPRVKASGKSYCHPSDGPNVPLGMKVAREALRGSKLPTPDEAALAKAKADEKREQSQAKNPFRKAATAVATVMRPIQY